MRNKLLLVLLCFFTFIAESGAFNLRKATLKDCGSIVYSIFQDDRGLIWITTNTGVYTYDGKGTIQFDELKGAKKIVKTFAGDIYGETLYGLKLLDNSNSTSTFEIFNNISFSASDSKGTYFFIQSNGAIYYKNRSQKNIDNVIISDLIVSDIKAFTVDNKDILQVVKNDGTLRRFEIVYKDDVIHLREKTNIKIGSSVLFCFADNNSLYIIDNEYQLYKINTETGVVTLTANLRTVLSAKGMITAAVYFKNEFYIGTEAGLFVIQENTAKLLVDKEITCIIKDKFQDLIWIATAGEGVYTYSYDPHIIKSNHFADFFPSVTKPVTALCVDTLGSLWIGTGGNGVIVVPNYENNRGATGAYSLSDKSGLPDNIINTFCKSEYGIWIGSKSGLIFYSYKSRTINKFPTIPPKDIRAIYQQDSTLWLACYEHGIIKADITYKDSKPYILQTDLYWVNNGDESSNRFSSISGNGKHILFVNTGNGIFRLEYDDLKAIKLSDKKFNSINRIIPIGNTNYIAATDLGVLKFSFDGESITNISTLNDIGAKDIVQAWWDDCWLSTDKGLALYNAHLATFRYFDNSYGLTDAEYQNGASYKDIRSNIMFFGGINGFTAVEYNRGYDTAMDYMPKLYLAHLSLFGTDRNINDFTKGETDELTFSANENFFSVTFNALDYINGNNYIYYYKIADGQWVNIGNSGTVSFTNISPGRYQLSVKYYNKILNKESYTRNISLIVLPPWYRSTLAYIVYSVLFLFAIYLSIGFVSKRRYKKQEEENLRAEQHRKEEIYEAKLDFFTDIAHEFCTPLTLISGPCNLILDQKKASPSITKYANIISRNAKRMTSLIGDLMDFKQMESGYKFPEVQNINILEVVNRVADSFRLNISGTEIKIRKHNRNDIFWNTDEKFLTTILINLISNAIKYSAGEPVKIEISADDNNLTFSVSNKGQGIAQEDIASIFNRFSVSDSAQKQSGWMQNGLGLTITASMIKLLSGNIEVDSIPDGETTFIVKLPQLEVTTESSVQQTKIDNPVIPELILPQTKYLHKNDLPIVTVIDDNPEMLWFICDVLSDEFNVLPINNPSMVVETLSKNHTDIILCDIMMGKTDGIQLTRILKSDKNTLHIPLIIVSAVHDIEMQTEAINAGAELYITKPFDNLHLKTTIKRLLGRKKDLKDYFASPLSAYELSMGKLQHSEHRKFLKRIYSIIDKNIQNEKLSPNFIASELGLSTRSLYRKLKDATDKGLLEIIRDGKLAVAENLLLKSKFTVDEIIFKSGFSNRASFYRAFSQKYGCSPSEFIERSTIQ